MDPGLVIVIAVVTLNSFLGLMVFLGEKNKIRNIFSALTLFVILWSLANYLAEVLNNESTVKILVGFTYAAAVIITTLFLRFSWLFPRELKKWSVTKSLILYSSSFLFVIISFTDLIVSKVHIDEPLNSIDIGPAMPLFIIYFLVVMCLAFWLLFRKYFLSEGIEKYQVFYVILGTILSVLGATATNLVVPFITEDWEISRYGPNFTIFLVTFSSYAILKHHLFDLRIVATELLTFSIWTFLLAQTLLADSLRNQLINGGLLILVIIFGIFLIKSVIKEVKQREEIEKLAKELRKANDRQTSLIHFITHQVKGFFTKSRNIFAELIEGDFGKITPEMKVAVEEGFRSDTKAVNTVQQILNAANISKGTIKYTKRPFDLKKLLEEEIKREEGSTKEKGLALKINIDEDTDFTFKGDRDNIKHVIHNLIDNAIKYTPEGEVEISLSKTADKYRFSVKDSGIGITAEDMPRLFTEGGRGKDSIKVNVDSTGYGLFIVKGIVEAHGGKVWAESEGKGKGSTFIAEFPTN